MHMVIIQIILWQACQLVQHLVSILQEKQSQTEDEEQNFGYNHLSVVLVFMAQFLIQLTWPIKLTWYAQCLWYCSCWFAQSPFENRSWKEIRHKVGSSNAMCELIDSPCWLFIFSVHFLLVGFLKNKLISRYFDFIISIRSSC